jgi:hypothetical protein
MTLSKVRLRNDIAGYRGIELKLLLLDYSVLVERIMSTLSSKGEKGRHYYSIAFFQLFSLKPTIFS